jgi:Kef-type K+ transport system membrane component KefB
VKKVLLGAAIVPLAIPFALWLGFEGYPVRDVLFAALIAETAMFVVRAILGDSRNQSKLRMRQVSISLLTAFAIVAGVAPRVAFSVEGGLAPDRAIEAIIGLGILARALIWIWKRRCDEET